MNMTSMKNAMKKLVFPLLVGGIMCFRGAAQAGDIINLFSPQANTTLTAGGSDYVDITFRLYGKFGLYSLGGGSTNLFMPTLAVVVNRMSGKSITGTAEFGGISANPSGSGYKTDVTFRYSVKPGDMAEPLRVYGWGGSGGSGGAPYTFIWNGYEIRNMDTTSNVVWEINSDEVEMGQSAEDLNFGAQQVTLKALDLPDGINPTEVAASAYANMHVTTFSATRSAVPLHVWTPDTNLVQIGTVAGQSHMAIQITNNTTEAGFLVKGLSPGVAHIYVMSQLDYVDFAASTNFLKSLTNYVTRAIEVTPAPEPSVSIIMTATGSGNYSLNESDIYNLDTSAFVVTLSEKSTNDVYVLVNTAPAGQGNLTFDLTNAPLAWVKVPANSYSSAPRKFNAKDGLAAVELIPASLTPAAAAAKYTGRNSAFVDIQNVKPTVSNPVNGELYSATRYQPFNFVWEVADVEADQATMTLFWNFGDGSTNITHGASGIVAHTYNVSTTAGLPRTAKVYARDKNGAVSDTVTFTVEVKDPEPQPSLRVVPRLAEYGETSALNTGILDIFLSEKRTETIAIQLAVTLNGSSQNNITLLTNMVYITGTNYGFTKFSIPDGTVASELYGLIVTPTILTAPANTYFTDVQAGLLFVTNNAPVVTKPVARDYSLTPLPIYTNVVTGVPFTFDYRVDDASGDTNSMIVVWDMGDGTSAVVTGAVGKVVHTYAGSGTRFLSMQAFDKDGGASALIEFPIYTVPPPPAPYVRINKPAGDLYETIGSAWAGSIGVELSQSFTNDVYVRLDIDPPTNAVNGVIKLQTNLLFFAKNDAAGLLKTVNIQAVDGTDVSFLNGFRIIPKVIGVPAATNFFTDMKPGLVTVINKIPIISNAGPTASPAQDVPCVFSWSVSDVDTDVRPTSVDGMPPMRVVWDFGDGHSGVGYGASGMITNTYATVGLVKVQVIAYDKDNAASAPLWFEIEIRPTKNIIGRPKGPSNEIYEGMVYPLLGAGRLYSPEAYLPQGQKDAGSEDINFTYLPSVRSAKMRAVPYRNNGFDSFFFVWEGTEELLGANNLIPDKVASPASTNWVQTVILMTADSTNTPILEVKAVFSREKYQADNMGDINQDGIPDYYAFKIERARAKQTGVDPVDTKIGTDPTLYKYNDDYDSTGVMVGDFLPKDPARLDFRPVGDPFTALMEVRGFEEGLNSWVSIPDGVRNGVSDEPGTDATLADSDNDGYLDGWEYYFWYHATMDDPAMEGSAYDPSNPSVGTLIPSSRISVAFDPDGSRKTEPSGTLRDVIDLDNDGLTDLEEMVLGTNPCQWDTDGDGMCDGWEVLNGLNARRASDAAANTDGDFMAYAEVNRYLVTGSDGKEYLSDAAVTSGDPLDLLVLTGARITTTYRYGDATAIRAEGYPLSDTDLATVIAAGDGVLVPVALLHFQVMREFGFDPRTAWTHSVNFHDGFARWPAWLADTPNTRPFTALDEYLLIKFMSGTRMNGVGATVGENGWPNTSTDPLTPDSDVTINMRDGMPDGWELYVAVNPLTDLSVAANRTMRISPWTVTDGDLDHPNAAPIRDGLINRREFAGTDSSARYTNAAQYASAVNTNFFHVVTIVQPAADKNWVNKYWPTNPWSPDTDGDGMNDLAEKSFFTGTAVDNHSTCVVGGGLNPDSVDTDLDALPDGWEFEYRAITNSVVIINNGVTNSLSITNGMDGTVSSDYDKDWDGDGLLNYQEYWTQAVRGFRYDLTTPAVPMDTTFEPSSLFTEVTNPWDRARFPWGNAGPRLFVLLPLVNIYDIDNQNHLYATTDPRMYDTDLDGMDDYYEMYHGLNPILGDDVHSDNTIVLESDRVAWARTVNGALDITYHFNAWNPGVDPLPLDFVNYPWMTGLPEADPDSDGLRNLEEKLQPNTAAPAYYNTDPSPLWFTDDSNTNSATSRFYHPMGYTTFKAGLPAYTDGNVMFYWPPLPVIPPASVYSYEQNEGYDTDNDGVSDKAEVINSRNRLSDPQDFDDPARRQAIWFSGSESAACSTRGYTFGVWTLRSFTAELWARPEAVNDGLEHVLLERVVQYSSSDLSNTNKVARRNFRIGIAKDGRVYGSFDNAGVHDTHTASPVVYGNVLTPNSWVHIAVRMDGAAGQFTLMVNGEIRDTIATTLIPANGLVLAADDVANSQQPDSVGAGTVCVGAACILPAGFGSQTWAENYGLYYKGFIDEVRIWDGARSNDEIYSNYKRRFTKNDLWNNRLLVRTEAAKGASRIWTNPLQLSPELLYHYTFDNLFSADVAAHVAKVPRGFNDPAVKLNRPPFPGSQVAWWAENTNVHSRVYNDYQYVPWIENGVQHLPIFGSATYNPNTDVVTVLMTNAVANSVFWTHTSAGAETNSFAFPNSDNPYVIATDLLPLGDAYAKQADVMWDEQGASGVWVETDTDTDSDGLPDWWETYMKGDAISLDWNAVNPVSRISYGEQYQRDIANGMTSSYNPTTNPADWNTPDTNADLIPDSCTPTATNVGVKQTADSDGDGMPDWWENIFNLNPASDVGVDGALGDKDLDGLSNLSEYMISEVYKFRYLSPNKFKTAADQTVSDYYLKQGSLTLGAMFTDHDFIEDTWEDQFGTSVISRYAYDPMGDEDGDGWSNWAESRYRIYSEGTRPDVSMRTEVFNLMNYEFPVPTIKATLRYKGLQSGGSLVLQTYTTASMSGTPDATYNVPNATAAVTTKTQPIGYWANKTVNGRLSPGSIQPGSTKFNFTDLWTGISSDTGFDINGILYAGAVTGISTPIGTINYETGEFELHLTYYKDRRIILAAQTQARTDYIDCNLSYVQMTYSVRAIATWPKTVYLGRADVGYVREGTNYVFAFMDKDSSGTWEPGEPCGVATPIVSEIGWDFNQIEIQLTDYTPSYLRTSLAGVRSEDVISGAVAANSGGTATTGALTKRVRVRRTLSDGTAYSRVVLEKEIQTPRNYLHEGDLLTQGEFGLDWGLTGVPLAMPRQVLVYELSIANATASVTNNLVFTPVAVFTNLFEATRAQAVATEPIRGKYVYSSRPTFKWTMPDGYTAFAIEILKGSDAGPVVYQSGTIQAPLRSDSKEYYWQAPISAGDLLPSGQIFTPNTLYVWHVIALNSKFTLTTAPITWSAWNVFRLDGNTSSSASGYGELRTSVKYYGPATALITDRVKVQVYRDRGFCGVPDAQCTLSGSGLVFLTNNVAVGTNAVLRGLTTSASQGNYYVRAYIDSNQNNVRDPWESWGYANYYGLTDTPYSARPSVISASSSMGFATVIIEDCDTDQDWFPDAWEYEQHPGDPNFLRLTGPLATSGGLSAEVTTGTNLLAAVNNDGPQAAIAMMLVAGTSDQDADGVGDLAELILGMNPTSSASAHDGYMDAEKLSIGLSGTDSLDLGVTALNALSAEPTVTWQVNVALDKAVNRALLSSLTGVNSETGLTYYIDYKASLFDTVWTQVGHGSVPLKLDGATTVQAPINENQSMIDPTKGFYRVRLSK